MSLPVNPSVSLTPQQAWKATMEELKLQMTKATYNSWLEPSVFAGHAPATPDKEQIFFIKVHNHYALDWIENRLNDTILRTLGAICNAPVHVKYSVRSDDERHPSQAEISRPHPPENPPQQEFEDASGVTVRGKVQFENGRVTQSENFYDNTPKTQQTPNGNEPVKISGRITDNPFDAGFIFTPNYALWFWQPYLGRQAYTFYQLLDSFYHEAVECNEDWPSISKISRMLGYGRHGILGRPNSGSKGLVGILEKENILKHEMRGPAHKRTHHFNGFVRMRDLPLLTPSQVATLDKPIQNDHKRWLKRHSRHFDLNAWELETRTTRILPVSDREEA